MRRLLAALDRLEEAFLGVALAFMTLLTFVQVVLRYVFDSGFVWSLEATTYTFAWMVLIGMSYCVRTRSHIAVDAVTTRLPIRIQRPVAALGLLLGLVYCGYMFYGGAVLVDRLVALGNDARDIPLPRWLLTGILPVAFVLLAGRLIQAAWPVLTGRDSGPPAHTHR
jgi:C4-dicarboxylate transporter DctQ subunit